MDDECLKIELISPVKFPVRLFRFESEFEPCGVDGGGDMMPFRCRDKQGKAQDDERGIWPHLNSEGIGETCSIRPDGKRRESRRKKSRGSKE